MELSVPPKCCHPSLLKMNWNQNSRVCTKMTLNTHCSSIAGVSFAFQTAGDLCIICARAASDHTLTTPTNVKCKTAQQFLHIKIKTCRKLH